MSAELISRLSHRPSELLNSMITISDPPKPMDANFQDRLSSIGILDKLPLKLLYHEVLSELDFQSLTRLARVSIQGKYIIQSFPAYRALMNHASHALAALGQTKLIHLHSASDLLTALRTERCATCPEYGAYLFLPTCERCCWQCLRSHPMRRVISPAAAGRLFALSLEMRRQLPVMFSIPGTYGVPCTPTERSTKLCSMFAAKEVALSAHGSTKNLTQAVRSRDPRWQTARCLQAVLEGWACLDSIKIPPEQGDVGVGRYFGMASIPFPSLAAPDVIEHGLWCKGCEWTYKRYEDHQLSAQVVANIRYPDYELSRMATRAHSRIGLLAHVQRCYGAQQLLADEEVEESRASINLQ
ncbi:F-box domain-containing protein [Nemania abortiva]|nr:F-box domain-containing protein [Nemania abortiva]